MKRFLFYFTSTVVIGFIFYLGMDYQLRLQEESAATYNLKPYILFTTFFPIFIGFLLRLPQSILEVKEKKQWSFDWIKVAAIGIPSLYIALIPILSFYWWNLILAKELMLLGDTTFTTIAGVIFGYVLLDCFNNTSDQE